MDINEIYGEINSKYPDLVENLLKKSSLETDAERQTIYGDLMDWLRDYYTIIPLKDRDMVAKMLLGDYVINHPYCLQKVYVLKQESDVDCEIITSATIYRTIEGAKKALEEEKDTILNESYHFGICKPEEVEIEEDEDGMRWFISDPCDSYYEDLTIKEKRIF